MTATAVEVADVTALAIVDVVWTLTAVAELDVDDIDGVEAKRNTTLLCEMRRSLLQRLAL